MKKLKILGIILLGIILAGCNEQNKNTLSGKHKIEIEIKDYGVIKATLDADNAPITVENFLKLVDEKFYDGLTIHRIVKDFVIQGGDPEGTGAGGSKEKITGEFSSNGINNPLSHTRGALSMARSNDYNSASSQFFIVQKDATTLDGDYAVFGYVTEGMDIVDKMVEEITPIDEMGTVEKEKQPIITSIKRVKEAKNNN